jgi:hypothetical protein
MATLLFILRTIARAVPIVLRGLGTLAVALVRYRTIIYPAVIGFVVAVVHLIGVKDEMEKKIVAVMDKGFGVLAAGVMVWGIMADKQNANVKRALTTQADAINHNADLQDPRTDTNPLQVPPAYVPSPPQPPVDPPTPSTQVKP